MKFLFMVCAAAIAVVYYAGVSQDMKAFDEGMSSLLSAFTDNSGMTIDSTIESFEPEEETVYYLPPGQPKEEKDVVYG